MLAAGIIPLGLWGALRWFGSESANLLECWALYGYANLIWIPVALISWSPIPSMSIYISANALFADRGSPELCVRGCRLRHLRPLPLAEPLPGP